MSQQHRPGPSSMVTTWPPALPTPPPSASLYRGPISPSGFPLYPSMQSVPVGVFPPHSLGHGGSSHGSRSVSGPAVLAQARYLLGYDTTHVPISQGSKPDLRHFEVVDLTQNGPGDTHDMQAEPPTPPRSSSPQSVHALKRPHSATQASDNQQGGPKKPRVEGEAPSKPGGPTTPAVDTPSQSPAPATYATPITPPRTIPLPPDTTDAQVNGNPAVSTVDTIRSYEECVNLIFERDADVEYGVFCGLCL
ncbi:hypothetical protein PAXRUDRAFT_189979 [Paxillus rubicundulus Ve08.2h10]|uniref:Uncharacterized protein n=1 Tax=Paxillus rubicundulus Ve08.2h10 TaxID=930991 RepID=A0A0D0EAN6_9AGAM|nr:hypothetical protein PAXRUDRAFT_189979 [Paxillus rubicundulus Ve08.2h10]